MQTTIVPEQVKTQKIHAGVQVSRLEGKDVIFSIASALEDFILLDFVIVRNIVEFKRISLTGFRSCTTLLVTERLKADNTYRKDNALESLIPNVV
ncbi:hypothetical protein Tco_0078855 [Tanacetum coccineum]